VTVANSTVSGNSAGNIGGGIANNGGGTIRNSTITNNVADADGNGTGDGGGLFRGGGTFTIENSIIAGNRDLSGQAPDLGGDFAGSTFSFNLIGSTAGATNVTLGAGNRVGVDPGLFPPGNYGGPTQTHALRPDSPALNAGSNALAAGTTDQRRVARISGGAVDIGAYESAGFALMSLVPIPERPPANLRFDVSVQFVKTAFNTALPLANLSEVEAELAEVACTVAEGYPWEVERESEVLEWEEVALCQMEEEREEAEAE